MDRDIEQIVIDELEEQLGSGPGLIDMAMERADALGEDYWATKRGNEAAVRAAARSLAAYARQHTERIGRGGSVPRLTS